MRIDVCIKEGWQPSETFQKDFKDGLLDKIKNAFPLVRHLNLHNWALC
jgi:hypothetical protein